MTQKIVRTVTAFGVGTASITPCLEKVAQIVEAVKSAGYLVQTDRICMNQVSLGQFRENLPSPNQFCSVGTLSFEEAVKQKADFLNLPNGNFNLDITAGVTQEMVTFLFDLIKEGAAKTFGFTYVVNNAPNSPYFPSATYGQSGYAIGLQTTDLAAGCRTVDEWLNRQLEVWEELVSLFGEDPAFLGIDSSVAPIFDGESSLIHFINRITPSFSSSVTTDILTSITHFIKEKNPKPIGLCGLMFPCLEDFELARAYEAGEFSIERNLFLALHSGLGIDTYPIGIDESPERVFEILSLLRALSNKYRKPLSARFVSDGKARIGDRTDFQNQYLADVVVRPL